jgi:hypothetical protein
MGLTGHIVAEANLDRPDEICIDSIGVGGGVADRLREVALEFTWPCQVLDINVAECAALNPAASRLRDDLWLQARDALAQRNMRLPKDEILRTDLIAPTYKFMSNGKLVVEPKAEMKKRLRRSPDRADAFCLTFGGQAARVGGRTTVWRSGKPLKRGLSLC